MGKKVHRSTGPQRGRTHGPGGPRRAKRKGQMRGKGVGQLPKSDKFQVSSKVVPSPKGSKAPKRSVTARKAEKRVREGGEAQMRTGISWWGLGTGLASRSVSYVSGAASTVMKDAIAQGVQTFFKVASMGETSAEEGALLGEYITTGMSLAARKATDLSVVQKGSALMQAAGAKAEAVAEPLVDKAGDMVVEELIKFEMDRLGYVMDLGSSPAALNCALNLSKLLSGQGAFGVKVVAVVLSHLVRVELGIEEAVPLDELVMNHIKMEGNTNFAMDRIEEYKALGFLQKAALRPVVGQISRQVQYRLGTEQEEA